MRLLLLLWLCLLPAVAEPVSVGGQPLEGPVSGRGDSTCVGLEELAQALQAHVLPVSGGWYVTRKAVQPDQVQVEPETVVVDDLVVESHEEDGRRLVNLRQFVRALGGEVKLADGRLSVVPPPPGRKVRRVNPGDVKAILKGPVEATELPGPSPTPGSVLVRVNQPGQKVVLKPVPGKTTIVYFMTPWNAACKAMTPQLEAGPHPVLVVDIKRQNSPVARQYKISKVPAFLVFGPNGKVQARGETARKLVLKLLRS